MLGAASPGPLLPKQKLHEAMRQGRQRRRRTHPPAAAAPCEAPAGQWRAARGRRRWRRQPPRATRRPGGQKRRRWAPPQRRCRGARRRGPPATGRLAPGGRSPGAPAATWRDDGAAGRFSMQQGAGVPVPRTALQGKLVTLTGQQRETRQQHSPTLQAGCPGLLLPPPGRCRCWVLPQARRCSRARRLSRSQHSSKERTCWRKASGKAWWLPSSQRSAGGSVTTACCPPCCCVPCAYTACALPMHL